jgi:ubiquinol-cytochrome c reductase iron-sulfur subunit
MSERPSSRFAAAAAAVIALRTGWRALRRGGPPRPGPGGDTDGSAPYDPSEREVPANRGAELLVALLLFGAALAALAFIAFYVIKQFNTQLLGLAMGCALALLAAAAIIAGKGVVVQETHVEERDQLLKPEQVEETVEIVEAGGEGISRRGLLTCATCVAGGAVVAAAAAPLASLGPASRSLHQSPWRPDTRLLDDLTGKPYAADEIQIGTFYTALAEGADPEDLGSALVLIRLPQQMIHMSPQRRSWTPQGLMAFSKICPHAGCAISLYRYPTYGPTSVSQPAFTCPCHYSTFLPGDGGRVIFGPAGRPLPQLPLKIDAEGNIRAAGGFDQDVGPSWWGVRRQ